MPVGIQNSVIKDHIFDRSVIYHTIAAVVRFQYANRGFGVHQHASHHGSLDSDGMLSSMWRQVAASGFALLVAWAEALTELFSSMYHISAAHLVDWRMYIHVHTRMYVRGSYKLFARCFTAFHSHHVHCIIGVICYIPHRNVTLVAAARRHHLQPINLRSTPPRTKWSICVELPDVFVLFVPSCPFRPAGRTSGVDLQPRLNNLGGGALAELLTATATLFVLVFKAFESSRWAEKYSPAESNKLLSDKGRQ
jgi:hypothetical protein